MRPGNSRRGTMVGFFFFQHCTTQIGYVLRVVCIRAVAVNHPHPFLSPLRCGLLKAPDFQVLENKSSDVWLMLDDALRRRPHKRRVDIHFSPWYSPNGDVHTIVSMCAIFLFAYFCTRNRHFVGSRSFIWPYLSAPMLVEM